MSECRMLARTLSVEFAGGRYPSSTTRRPSVRFFLALLASACVGGSALASPMLTGPALVEALHRGGYVLVMRHANSPSAPPEKDVADPANTKLERQLDDTGRATAREMGQAFKTLAIPIGEIDSSPTYRARETVRLAGFGAARSVAELDEVERGMSGQANARQAEWLRNKAREQPRPAVNTIVVTHTPNIVGAFGDEAARIAAGEALVFRPDGKGGTELVARIKIEEWPKLARP
jgi:phosphohistidine phosphatase SixA